MPSMYGPNRSPFDDYVDYWGGYARPPHPPPPPPLPHDEPDFHPPPPLHFRPVRPPPPPPPVRHPRSQHHPYPPEDRKNSSGSYRSRTSEYDSNQQNYRRRHSNGGLSPRRPYDYDNQQEDSYVDSSNDDPPELFVGSPLVPRRKEPEPRPASKPIPNNKRPIPVELDPNLPKELVAKLHNNCCDLCDVKLNSRIQAKNHYEGKQHRKKVKNYIIEKARKEDQPPEKMPKIDLSTPKKKVEPLDVSQLHCKCCDLSFTSEQHAQQHFMGRNHQRVLHGLKPLKAGYYNKETGKWQRTPPDPRVSVERMGLNLESPSEDETGERTEKPFDLDTVKEKGRFFCEMCNVSATSQDQLDGHMTGQRHLKALRLSAKKAIVPSSGP